MWNACFYYHQSHLALQLLPIYLCFLHFSASFISHDNIIFFFLFKLFVHYDFRDDYRQVQGVLKNMK